MAAQKSVQETNRAASPVVYNPPSDIGKEWTFYFNYVCATFNSGDTLDLANLPKGSRVMGGKIAQDALGGSTTLIIGVSGSTSKYLGSTATSSAGETVFANTIALNYGDLLTADTVVFATLGGANATDAKVIKGHIKVLFI